MGARGGQSEVRKEGEERRGEERIKPKLLVGKVLYSIVLILQCTEYGVLTPVCACLR